MRKHYKSIIAALVVIVGGYYWYSAANPAQQPVRYVTTPVEQGTLVTSVAGSGNIAVHTIANVDPTISGTVANLSVSQGDSVKKGQLLFTIIDDQLGVSAAQSAASLQQAQNGILSAKASHQSAQASLDSLQRSSTSTGKQVKAAKTQVTVAEQGEIAAQKSLAAAQAAYANQYTIAGQRKVTAPIDGTVSAVNIKNGDNLGKSSSATASQTPIIIGDLGTLEAQVAINEVDISQVAAGQKVTLQFPAITGLTLTGKVEQIDALGTVTQGVVTYNARVAFDTIDPRLKPGMSVSASIIVGSKQDVLIVPNGAVKAQGNNMYVQVVKDGALTPVQTSVQTGLSNNTEMEITSGLSAGDNVVTQTIDPNAKTTTSTGGGAGGVRIPGLGGGGRG